MRLSALVDCASCGVTYDGQWTDDSDTVQDMDEAPVADQVCPDCGHVQEETWPGFISYTEAG